MEENRFKNDENYKKFSKYIKKALIHRRINYLKQLERKIKNEITLEQEEWENMKSSKEEFVLEEVEDIVQNLDGVFDSLNHKQKLILVMFYDKKMPYSSIGKELGISGDYARKVKMEALKKIREKRGIEDE